MDKCCSLTEEGDASRVCQHRTAIRGRQRITIHKPLQAQPRLCKLAPTIPSATSARIPPSDRQLLAFHPIFSSLASGSNDSTVKVWDWELGELERTLKGRRKAVLDVNYGSPRGSILLASCSSDSTIRLWGPADEYKNIRTLAGHGS
ncbi:hypothetical protein N657DRAFT_278463 [Parathielavia appendiculata]|uniref:Uncharacterized protein n=1 Tax=Parathielavia appendiculata TaxID=2587402 RepID=A0AAN6Z5X1_9PEZI|nr:hypothetical protein N657DRAFT_278463 [Parathielavia appendiculata]